MAEMGLLIIKIVLPLFFIVGLPLLGLITAIIISNKNKNNTKTYASAAKNEQTSQKLDEEAKEKYKKEQELKTLSIMLITDAAIIAVFILAFILIPYKYVFILVLFQPFLYAIIALILLSILYVVKKKAYDATYQMVKKD